MCRRILFFIMLLIAPGLFAQEEPQPFRLNLNKDGERYIQFAFNGQFWFRSMQMNPGTVIQGDVQNRHNDFLLRRFRFIAYGPITDRMTFVAVAGDNNVNFEGGTSKPVGILDFFADYRITPWLSIGGGKTTWHGLSRYSSAPSTINFLNVDLPIFALPSVLINDDIGRKLSAYAKGQVGRFDYRVTLSRPYAPSPMTPSEYAQFDSENNTFRTAGYFKYQFLDKESNLLPFAPGSYWATKKVFNIGIGYDYHPDAMVRLENGVRKNEDMFHLSADIFYDAPLNENTGTAISLYGAWFRYDYGYKYLRNVGLVNPATGSIPGEVMASGPGNSYPMMGSGEIVYGQAGYMLPSKFKNFTLPFRLQLMGAAHLANYDRLNESMFWYETGLNILVDKYSKFTFSYQGRPVFEEVASEPQSRLEVGTRKGTFIFQYQFTVR